MKSFYSSSLLLVIQVLLSGCGKGASPVITNRAKTNPQKQIIATTAAGAQRLSLSEATAAVRQEIFRTTPGMNLSAQFPLKELTTADVWDRLHAQVLAVTSDVDDDQAFIIRDRQVFPLSTGFGGNGVIPMCVAVLNGDGQPKLFFTFSWGSGIHRSLVGLWTGGASWVDARPALADYDLSLERIDDQHVDVSYGELSTGGNFKREGNFGTLRLYGDATKPILEIGIDPHLDKKILNRVWK